MSFRTDLWRFTRRAGTVSGWLWNNQDGDGQSAGEPGVHGVTVQLYDSVLDVTALPQSASSVSAQPGESR